MKAVGLISLGCPKNLVDSEIMLGLMVKAGYRIVTDPKKADIIIVNTCGFIEDAKRESIEAILEMARYKGGKEKYLVVTGCFPQRYKEKLLDLFPEVDLFVGTGEYHKIANLIGRMVVSDKRGVGHGRISVGVPEYIHSAKTPRLLSTPSHAVYIKIAEGCFHACSFCTIPRIRGRYRSRRIDDIVKEVASLVSKGTKELNLIAQDTTAYGRDLKDGSDISSLIEKISEISGEKWIRLLYAYPQSIRKNLVKTMKECREFCRYLDIPIQHIDNDILELMRRGRSEKNIRGVIDYLRSEVPEIAIRTTVITGFPGETERRFRKLLKFIEEGHFDHVGVFTYSEEEGTAAARLHGRLSEEVKRERQETILTAQKKISRKRLKRYVGKKIKILVEGASQETAHLIQGRAEFQAPEIDGVVYINDACLPAGGGMSIGQFYMVEISSAYDYDLVGKVI